MGEVRARDFQFLLVVVAVVALLAVLSMTGKERFIPRTEAHLAVGTIQDTAQADAACLSCHDGAKPASAEVKKGSPMPESHPLRKKNCRQCHRLERKKS
jgi:Tfp pilus assembly protein PilE